MCTWEGPNLPPRPRKPEGARVDTGERPRRADAARNRERLIAAATAAFGELGLEVGVAEIARRAGVGSATLFRNFPTKDDLINAVIERRLTEVERLTEHALAIDDAGRAFETLMFDVADMQAADLGFFEAMHTRMLDDPELSRMKARMIEKAAELLRRAQEAGAVRADIEPEDLRFLLMSVVRKDPEIDAPDAHRRYLRIILDGMRPRPAAK